MNPNCPGCRRLSEEMAAAAVEIVRLRVQVQQLGHELRRYQVRESGISGAMLESAEMRRERVGVVRAMCDQRIGDE
jgi:hypothetical protein